MRVAIGSRALAACLLSLYALLFCLRTLETLQVVRAPRADARDYVTIAWNIVHHGTVSLSPERPDKPP